MGKLLLGCSGWSYSDPAEKGGWTGAFYEKFSQHSMKNFTNI
jgi:hypothetical protein